MPWPDECRCPENPDKRCLFYVFERDYGSGATWDLTIKAEAKGLAGWPSVGLKLLDEDYNLVMSCPDYDNDVTWNVGIRQGTYILEVIAVNDKTYEFELSLTRHSRSG
ncbi:MAG TPA: hypothetical protein VM163_08480 [bacterium]|nr:hypothetical protein [bacterium]